MQYNNYENEFFDAIKKQDLNEIEKIISNKNFKPSTCNFFALETAVQHYNPDMFFLLIKHPDINIEEKHHFNKLIQPAICQYPRNKEIFYELKKSKFYSETINENFFAACLSDNLNIMQYYSEHKNFDLDNIDYYSLLLVLIKSCKYTSFEFLLNIIDEKEIFDSNYLQEALSASQSKIVNKMICDNRFELCDMENLVSYYVSNNDLNFVDNLFNREDFNPDLPLFFTLLSKNYQKQQGYIDLKTLMLTVLFHDRNIYFLKIIKKQDNLLYNNFKQAIDIKLLEKNIQLF